LETDGWRQGFGRERGRTPSESNLRKSWGAVFGTFRFADGRTMDFRFEPRDAEPGVVTIGGREYNCADGRLFLMRAGREVKQLHWDLRKFAGIPGDEFSILEDLASRDSEIASHYTPETEKSRTNQQALLTGR